MSYSNHYINSRREFERNISLMRENMEKIRISPDADDRRITTRSLKRARLLPNQRVNFSSINENIRSFANSLDQINQIQERAKYDQNDETLDNEK